MGRRRKHEPGRRTKLKARARRRQHQQEGAERKRLTPGQYGLRRAVGWGLVTAAVLIGVSHWLQHLGVFTILPHGLADLFVGYPAAAVLGVGGALVLSR